MIDVEKLNNTILNLESEVENIRGISRIVGELDRLNNEVGVNHRSAEDALTKLSKAREDLLSAISVYGDSLSNIKEIIVENDKSFDGKIQEIKEENFTFNRELLKSYKNMEHELLTQVQEIRNESKKLYLEFEDILQSKLERNKSDIEVEIRNSSNRIINVSEASMKLNNEELNKRLEKQNVFLFVLIGLAVVGIVLKFV